MSLRSRSVFTGRVALIRASVSVIKLFGKTLRDILRSIFFHSTQNNLKLVLVFDTLNPESKKSDFYKIMPGI